MSVPAVIKTFASGLFKLNIAEIVWVEDCDADSNGADEAHRTNCLN